jgi:pilus assembly protein Flp/PilA
MIARFLREERGATAIEYALIGVLIAVAIVAAVAPIGDQLAAIFGSAGDGFNGP